MGGKVASTECGNETEYLTKERVEKGVRREMYVRNRYENWRHDMATYYRGVKETLITLILKVEFQRVEYTEVLNTTHYKISQLKNLGFIAGLEQLMTLF